MSYICLALFNEFEWGHPPLANPGRFQAPLAKTCNSTRRRKRCWSNEHLLGWFILVLYIYIYIYTLYTYGVYIYIHIYLYLYYYYVILCAFIFAFLYEDAQLPCLGVQIWSPWYCQTYSQQVLWKDMFGEGGSKPILWRLVWSSWCLSYMIVLYTVTGGDPATLPTAPAVQADFLPSSHGSNSSSHLPTDMGRLAANSSATSSWPFIKAKSQAVCPFFVARSLCNGATLVFVYWFYSCWPRLQAVHGPCRDVLLRLQSTKVTSNHHLPCLLQRHMQAASGQFQTDPCQLQQTVALYQFCWFDPFWPQPQPGSGQRQDALSEPQHAKVSTLVQRYADPCPIRFQSGNERCWECWDALRSHFPSRAYLGPNF